MLTHVRAFVRDFHHTGSVMPSSGVFARAMTSGLRTQAHDGRGRRILEVGPGSGPMTREILKTLRPGDRLDIVEINPDFVDRIERDLLLDARRRMPDVEIKTHVAAIEEARLEPGYHHIISSLPLNNFDPTLVRRILHRFDELIGPDGELCFYEYALIRGMRRRLSAAAKRARFAALGEIFEEIDARPGVTRNLILLNVPPAIKRTVPAAAP